MLRAEVGVLLMAPSIEPARAEDGAAIVALLRAAALPIADLETGGAAGGNTSRSDVSFLVARGDDGMVAGVVGIEAFADAGLLRSLAVRADCAGRGLGQALVAAAEAHARQSGLRELVLLTETAEGLFAKLGYARCERADVPVAVQGSAEFASLCPASAACMRKFVAVRRVLFVCVENSNRSQMAEAFARLHGGAGVAAYSAGSRPSGVINPKAIRFMTERGVDLVAHASKSLDAMAGLEFDAVVTMGCGDSCPWVPARRREDWALNDPKNMDDAGYRAVRDDIEARVRVLLASL